MNIYIWIAIAVTSAAVGAGAAWKVQGMRLDAANGRTATVQAAFDTFTAKTAAEGKIAQAKAESEKKTNQLAKDKADETRTKLLATNADLSKQLRDSRARANGSGLHAPTPNPGSLGRTCFDPTKLSDALRQLDEGFFGIAEECSKAVIDLDSAKNWASELKLSTTIERKSP